jgi:hypothetical protein
VLLKNSVSVHRTVLSDTWELLEADKYYPKTRHKAVGKKEDEFLWVVLNNGFYTLEFS